MHTTRTTQRAALIVLALLALALLALLISPFASGLFIAAVLSGVLDPWCDRLEHKLGCRRSLAAGVLTIGVLLTIVIPFASLALMVGREAVDAASYVQTTLQSEGAQGIVNDLPRPARSVAQKIIGNLSRQQVRELSTVKGAKAASAVGNVLAATTSIFIQTVMMLIGLYLLLVDGKRLVTWLSEVVPLRPEQTLALLRDFRQVSVTVLVSSVATAAVQALVALAGYLIARVPQPLFFTFVTFIMAFVPMVGAGGVVVVAAALIFITGHTYSALFLAIWGVLVVGLSDNVLKPYLMKNGIPIHAGVIFFALLGGLSVFGGIGLLVGPLVVAFFLSVVRMCRREFAGETIAEPTVGEVTPST